MSTQKTLTQFLQEKCKPELYVSSALASVREWLNQKLQNAPSFALTTWKLGYCDGYEKAIKNLLEDLEK
jgi:hypothetical protein